jgi:hypothetical protein
MNDIYRLLLHIFHLHIFLSFYICFFKMTSTFGMTKYVNVRSKCSYNANAKGNVVQYWYNYRTNDAPIT